MLYSLEEEEAGCFVIENLHVLEFPSNLDQLEVLIDFGLRQISLIGLIFIRYFSFWLGVVLVSDSFLQEDSGYLSHIELSFIIDWVIILKLLETCDKELNISITGRLTLLEERPFLSFEKGQN